MTKKSRHSSSRRHHKPTYWDRILISLGLKKKHKSQRRYSSHFSYFNRKVLDEEPEISGKNTETDQNILDEPEIKVESGLEIVEPSDSSISSKPQVQVLLSSQWVKSSERKHSHHKKHKGGHRKSRYKKPKKSSGFKLFFKNFFIHIKEPLYNFLFFLNFRSAPYDPFLDSETVQPEERKPMRIQRYAAYVIQSTLVFIISYIIAYFIYQFAIIFMAAHFGIDSVLYYYEVMFPIGDASNLWTPFNIIMITLAGPVISLIFGLIWYRWVMRKVKRPAMKLFFLWLAFHSFNMFFGAFVAGVITNQGFGYVANWLYLGIPLKIFFSLIALGILTYLGWHSTPHILSTTNSPRRINRYNRSYFILSQMIIPWFIGSLLMLWIKIPNRTPQHENILLYDIIILVAMAFLVIPPLFNHQNQPSESKKRYLHKKTSFAFLYLFIAAILIIAYRFGLERGLHIVMRFDLSLSFYH
ncbi:MAG: hypothetical protein WBJ48_07850 [Bacteroidales bacterium]|nr:hypothetical protein [Bacteroidales bacterium]MBP9587988.1 hypothetical protein [Bacteroidales bacterium]HOH91384.1 hypothetical protein [Bacteroidales bacterium]HOU35283.1 hypothetical protein [Bacteroidales bacterium]HXK64205.1 hypothetical protein [Bacteroidales bacterium]